MTGNNKMRRLLTMGLFLTVALMISAQKKGTFVVFNDKMTKTNADGGYHRTTADISRIGEV